MLIYAPGVDTYYYCYDSIGRLIRQDVTDLAGEFVSSTEYTYDVMNNVTGVKTEAGGRVFTQEYSYSAVEGLSSTVSYAKDNLPTRYVISAGNYLDYRYDTLNRMYGKTLSIGGNSLYYNYIYKLSNRNENGDNSYKTTLVSTEIVGDDAFHYTYDANGNITVISKARRTTLGSNETETNPATAYRSYVYDALNELTRENDKTSNVTRKWEYDALGNILSRREYPYTTANNPGTPTKTVSYRYGNDGKTGWSYLLTGVDLDGNGSYGSGETITYDNMGNPTTYLGATLTWYGRQLTSYSKGGVTYTYTYGADGLRTSKTKTAAGVTTATEYTYVGDQLVYEKRGTTDIYYYYDSLGTPTSIKWYNGNVERTMYLATNMAGDVIGLYNDSGVVMVQFEYDAWGNIVSTTYTVGSNLSGSAQEYADICPFRYRGYYFDSDTGLYYVSSRYYDSEICRWINADDRFDEGAGFWGYNLFAYCANNPINLFDPEGSFVISTLLVCVIAGAVVGGIVGGFIGNNYANTKGYSGRDKTKCILAGVAIGGVGGGAVGYCAAPLVVGATGVAGISITVAGGITLIPSELLGQGHHLLSNPIMRALETHPLKGAFDRADSVIKALYETGHRGYQQWHRAIDTYMVNWLQNNPDATKAGFWREMYKMYYTKDMIARFGESALQYILRQIHKGG